MCDYQSVDNHEIRAKLSRSHRDAKDQRLPVRTDRVTLEITRAALCDQRYVTKVHRVLAAPVIIGAICKRRV